jgi:hypothetical protein
MDINDEIRKLIGENAIQILAYRAELTAARTTLTRVLSLLGEVNDRAEWPTELVRIVHENAERLAPNGIPE